MRRALVVAVVVGGCAAPAWTLSQDQPALAFTAQELLSHVRSLAAPALEGRRTGTPGNAVARAFIVDRFKRAGLVALGEGFEAPFRFTRDSIGLQGVNVVGACRGSAAKDGRTLVVSAHYDHVGIRDGQVYPGADDNASGVAVLLALARQCGRTSWMHDALFVAFDAEEMGLQGSRAFVAAPPVPRDRLALNVNMDMVSRSDTRALYVAGTHHRPQLRPVLEAVAARAPVTLRFGHDKPKAEAGGIDDWTMQSDHGAFHTAGIPFVYFGVEDHADYHKPTDTADKIDPAFLFQVATTILDAMSALDRALPTLRP